jgi:hypothetical protein
LTILRNVHNSPSFKETPICRHENRSHHFHDDATRSLLIRHPPRTTSPGPSQTLIPIIVVRILILSEGTLGTSPHSGLLMIHSSLTKIQRNRPQLRLLLRQLLLQLIITLIFHLSPPSNTLNYPHHTRPFPRACIISRSSIR